MSDLKERATLDEAVLEKLSEEIADDGFIGCADDTRHIAAAARDNALRVVVEWLKAGPERNPPLMVGRVLSPVWYAGDAIESALNAAAPSPPPAYSGHLEGDDLEDKEVTP